MLDRETQKKNLIWGWSLFALFVVLFVGTFVVALIYLAVD